jgi:hypothetical protein
MKAKQLAHLLDQTSAILKQFPDLELQTALSVILQAIRTPVSQTATSEMETPVKFQTTTKSTEDIRQQLEAVPTEQLETFIRTSKALKTKPQLQTFAHEAGIHYTSKTTKDELINLIVLHYQSKRTHSLIRGYQPEHATL